MSRANDPLAIEGPRSHRHWRRVAMIIGWRTGQDDYDDAPMPILSNLGAPSSDNSSGSWQNPAH
jgi:hypothetical protein